MNAPLLVAGSLELLAAAVHGIAGEVLVVQKLSPEMLPSTAFGGSEMTKTMIRATWHMTTIGFLTAGSALVLSGSVVKGEAARGMGLFAASAATGFAAVAVGGALARAPRSLFRHPAPVVLTTVALLAWSGIGQTQSS